jgi:exopolyphosphatase/guanosine-5'-triphosphate,3'-diphosphate pyrophosphatase
LRLAVLLQRDREDILPAGHELHAGGSRVELSLPGEWVDAHPLTWADLEQEQEYLQAASIDLVLTRS